MARKILMVSMAAVFLLTAGMSHADVTRGTASERIHANREALHKSVMEKGSGQEPVKVEPVQKPVTPAKTNKADKKDKKDKKDPVVAEKTGGDKAPENPLEDEKSICDTIKNESSRKACKQSLVDKAARDKALADRKKECGAMKDWKARKACEKALADDTKKTVSKPKPDPTAPRPLHVKPR